MFSRFAADTAEWRSANSAFEEGNTFPDMTRALSGGAIEPQSVTGNRSDFIEGGIDHTAYALLNVDPMGQDDLTAGATLPRGVAGAVALVGRTGTDTGGSSVVQIKALPKGGPGKVTLSNATSFSRVTAVIINSDVDIDIAADTDGTRDGYDQNRGDWIWAGDSSPITLAVNDITAAKLASVKPGRSSVQLRFNESVRGISASSVKLTGPGGRNVRVRVSRSRSGKIVSLRPTRTLSSGRRYTVKLAAGITDPGANPIASKSRVKKFTAR